MEIKRILWPTDFSENAAKALPCVTLFSEMFQCEVHVLYVLKKYGEWGAAYGDFRRSDYEKMYEWERKTAEDRLDEICEKFLDTCPLYIRHISVGDPAREILKVIDKENIDMVIMASQGSESHFNFGSVADKIIKATAVPITLIPIQKRN
jgi:nucleotide-binding universal stress UspA family protein